MGAALRKLEPIEFFVRDMAASDLAFVAHAWACGQRTAAPWCYQDGPAFSAQQNERMASLDDGAERVRLVVTLPDDPDARLGFIVGAGAGVALAVDWIYVREAFRGRGIARAMLDMVRKRTGVTSPREVVGCGWSKAAPGLVATLRRHGLSFRWAP